MSRLLQVMLGVAIVLSASGVRAQPAAEPSKGPFQVTLADATICLATLDEAQKALAAQAPASAELQIVRKIMEQAKASAGEPVKGAAIPWAFANNVAAGPYLQDITPSSVIIRWAALQSDLTVRYGPEGKLTSTAQAVRLPSPRRMHEAVLSGLKSGTQYRYSISMAGQEVGGSFRTPPEGDGAFTFAVWGDSQMDTPDHSPQPALAAQMAKRPIDLAITIGDIVDLNVTDGDFYQEFFQPAMELLRNVPFVAAVGNHESLGDPELSRYRRWMRHPGGQRNYYAFTYANCRFIVLDSNDLSPPQLEWLKQELASQACRNARFRFLALHHSPYCRDWYGGEQKVQQAVVPLAEQNKVDMIFGGHFHCYNRGGRTAKEHTTCYVVTGGGGGMYTQPERFGPGKNYYDFMPTHEWKHHFVLVKVAQDGLRVRAIDEKGELFDEFTPDTACLPPRRPFTTEQPPKAAPPSSQSQPVAAASPALALRPEETQSCTLSAADRAAAMTAIRDGLKALGEPQAEAAYRLALVAAVLEQATDKSRTGDWSGPFGRTGHLVPLVKLSDSFHYRLKPSETADAAVKAVLEDKQIKGNYQVAGEDLLRGSAFGAGLTGGWRWLLVDTLRPK